MKAVHLLHLVHKLPHVVPNTAVLGDHDGPDSVAGTDHMDGAAEALGAGGGMGDSSTRPHHKCNDEEEDGQPDEAYEATTPMWIATLGWPCAADVRRARDRRRPWP